MTPLAEIRYHLEKLAKAYGRDRAPRKNPAPVLEVAGVLERAGAEIEKLHGALLVARGRLLLANPRAETQDLDSLLLAEVAGDSVQAEAPCPAGASGLAGAPAVLIDYTNWRGERNKRTIQPVWLWWGQTEFHPIPQFLLRALDTAKGEMRDFAMNDVHSWSPMPATGAEMP